MLICKRPLTQTDTAAQTLTLLTDVTGDHTIDGTQDTGLNLNGHSIKGTVTVKAAAGSNTTTLSNTKNTTTASIDAVVAYKGAKLAGSGKSCRDRHIDVGRGCDMGKYSES